MSIIPATLAIVAAALFATGAGFAWWGHHELEPDFAYIGVLLIAASFTLAGILACGWLYVQIT